MHRYFFSLLSRNETPLPLTIHCASDILVVERRSPASETTANSYIISSALSITTLSLLMMKERELSRSNQSMTVQMSLPCDHNDIVSKFVHHSIGTLKICTDVSFTPSRERYSPRICYIMRWYQFAFIFWLHLTEFYNVQQFVMDKTWHQSKEAWVLPLTSTRTWFILSAPISKALKKQRTRP